MFCEENFILVASTGAIYKLSKNFSEIDKL